jgi:hypothetical protein
MKLTVLTNVFNEEYLLSFWLEHHRKIFDHGIVIDYRSTDSSMDIVRRICPTWEIRTTRNSHFDAVDIDREFMDIEQTISGHKIVLNTTEFLLSAADIRTLIKDEPNTAYSFQCLTACAEKDNFNPQTLSDLITGIERVEPHRRMQRSLHSYPSGNYSPGRHTLMHPLTAKVPVYVMWFGFYPWNNRMLTRKLQIKQNIPQRDIDVGYGFHHFWGIEEQMKQRALYASESWELSALSGLIDSLKKAAE